MPRDITKFQTHGSGQYDVLDFASIGHNVIIEPGVLVFHPQNIRLGNNVYIGHQTIIKGYFKNELLIEDNTWIGQQCIIHSAGGIHIGKNVGIGPGVKILTSYHDDEGIVVPILASRLAFAPVVIGENCDLGVGSIILPGVSIGAGVQVGAGAVVTKDVPANAVIAGVPARVIRFRV
jgi:acetyltransferase-like isoleucine patch superfamily enzyme